MTRNVPGEVLGSGCGWVVMGPFGLAAIQAQAGTTASRLAREAACYYLAEEGRGRPGWPYPRFRARVVSQAGPRCRDVPWIGGTIWLEFVKLAARQRVTTESLLHHALLFYVADLHAGRVSRESR